MLVVLLFTLQAGLLRSDALEPFMTMGGVRIEDNVAVTAAASSGHFNLTMAAEVPKEARVIEELMAENMN
jgi:Xaa-Pro aminopeptidase